MVAVTALSFMDRRSAFWRRAGAPLRARVRLLADAVAAVADALPAAVRTQDHLVATHIGAIPLVAIPLAARTYAAAGVHEARSFAEAAGVTKHQASQSMRCPVGHHT